MILDVFAFLALALLVAIGVTLLVKLASAQADIDFWKERYTDLWNDNRATSRDFEINLQLFAKREDENKKFRDFLERFPYHFAIEMRDQRMPNYPLRQNDVRIAVSGLYWKGEPALLDKSLNGLKSQDMLIDTRELTIQHEENKCPHIEDIMEEAFCRVSLALIEEHFKVLTALKK